MRNLKFWAWTTLVFTLAVIVWGALVRATGSGAGCGEHWPLCNGAIIPLEASTKTAIEFTHRVTSGLSLIFTVICFWLGRQHFKDPRSLGRKAANASLIFMLMEAALGAGLVLLGLVEKDQSRLRAFSISLHLVNTLILLGAQTALVYAVQHPDRTVNWKNSPHRERRWIKLAATGFLLLGITGAIAALGDTLFPATSLTHGLEQDLSPQSHFLLRLRAFHPFLAVVVGMGALLLARWLNSRLTQALVIAQWVAGLANLFLLAPTSLQLAHLLLADLLWCAALWTVLEFSTKTQGLETAS